jgi:hypothetical protein
VLFLFLDWDQESMNHNQEQQQQQQHPPKKKDHGVDFPGVQVRYSQAIDNDIQIFIDSIRNWTESVIGSDAIQPFLVHQHKKSQHGDTRESDTREEHALNSDTTTTTTKPKKSTVAKSYHHNNKHSQQNLTECLDKTTLDRMGRVLDVSLAMALVHALDATVESILVQSLVWRPSLSSCSEHHWVSYLGGGSGAGFTVHCATKSATYPKNKPERDKGTNDHTRKAPEDAITDNDSRSTAVVLLDASCGGGGAGRLHHHHPTTPKRYRNHTSMLRHHHPPKARNDYYYGYQGGSQLNVQLAHNQMISIVGGGKDVWKVEESILPRVGERNDDSAAAIATTAAASTAAASNVGITREDKHDDDDDGDDTVKPDNENSSGDGGQLDFMDQLTRHMQACASHQQLWIQGGGGGGWTAEVNEEEADDSDNDRENGVDPIGRISHRLESGFGFEFILAPPNLMPWLLLEQQRHEEEEKEEHASRNKQDDKDEIDQDINKEEQDDDAMHHSVSITSSSATESSQSSDSSSNENSETNASSTDGGPQVESQQNCMLLTNYKRDWKAIGECWASNSAQQHGPTTLSLLSSLLLLDKTVETFPTHLSLSEYTPKEANDTGSVLAPTVVGGALGCFFVVVVASLLTVPRLWRRRGYQTLPDH